MDKLIHLFQHVTEPQLLLKYGQYLYLIVFVYSFVEVIFPPIPGDALLIISGSISGRANLNPLFLIISACLGGLLGSYILYSFGCKMGHKMLDSPRFSKLIDSKGFARVESWFTRYGFLTLVVSRFIPVLRSGVILAAGIANMGQKRSLAAVAVSLLLSVSAMILGGRFLGRSWGKLVHIWNDHWRFVLWVLLCLVVIYLVVLWIVKAVKARRQGGSRHE